MATERIIGRFQTPVDKDGNRKDIFPITSSECILMKNNEERTLEDVVSQASLILSKEKPEQACLWGELKDTETDSND